MKTTKRERKKRAGDGLSGHPLATAPLNGLVGSLSHVMVRLLSDLADPRTVRSEEGWVSGAHAAAGGYAVRTVEGAVKRGIVEARWAPVPHRAPLSVKLDALRINERGRAALAAAALANPDVDLTGGSPWRALIGSRLGPPQMPPRDPATGDFRPGVMLPREHELTPLVRVMSGAVDVVKEFSKLDFFRDMLSSGAVVLPKGVEVEMVRGGGGGGALAFGVDAVAKRKK